MSLAVVNLYPQFGVPFSIRKKIKQVKGMGNAAEEANCACFNGQQLDVTP